MSKNNIPEESKFGTPEHFLSWLKQQPEYRPYNYLSTEYCPVAQYGKAYFSDAHHMNWQDIRDEHGVIIAEIYPCLDFYAGEVCQYAESRDREPTFGELTRVIQDLVDRRRTLSILWHKRQSAETVST